MKQFSEMTCTEFTDALASSAPVPGGGGASALTGALGAALCNMVGSLTLGKKKYADVQEEILRLKDRADDLQTRMLALIGEDAKAFEPLSRAYGLPKDTPEQQAHKAEVMEAALREASAVPLAVMRLCCEAIDLHAEMARIGSAIAISDVGVGVRFCGAALEGAALNVFINTKLMKDRVYADGLNAQADHLLARYVPLAQSVYADVAARLR